MGVPEKIKLIEEEMSKTKVNKNTEHHVGILKAKLARLRREQEEKRNQSSGSQSGYGVRKSGDGTIALIGLPNVGKSSLLNKLTNSRSKVGAFKFTTLTVVPGVLNYKGASIQILDLPGIIESAASGKGLGKRVLSVARSADLIILVTDIFRPQIQNLLIKELREMGIRPDEAPPKIVIEKTRTGGIAVTSLVKLTRVSIKLIKEVLRIYKINNARVIVKEDITDEQLIDSIMGNRKYVSTLSIINKIDLINGKIFEENKLKKEIEFIPVSIEANKNIEEVKEAIYQRLDFIRIYLRPKGSETDYKEPLVIKNGSIVQDACDKLHRNMKKDLRYAQIWGKSVKFGGQKVGLLHQLQDEDVLTIITK